MVSKSGDTPETQNMRRALQVLRVLGSHHEEGVSVSDVVAATQLERSTAHRLLTCLVENISPTASPVRGVTAWGWRPCGWAWRR